MMNVKIVIAAHKEYEMPKGEIYLPIFAGSALSDLELPYQRDDQGDNISDRNPSYCELTALFWAYKNLKADYIGLCHYRRYLNLDGVDIESQDILLPKKRHYYIETVYDQFGHAHGYEGLNVCRSVISNRHPEYLRAFDICMKRRSLHLYNMFVMRYEVFLEYCDFLFDVLFECEKVLGTEDRLYGYLGERLLDVFIEKNAYPYRETKKIETEPVDWPKKIIGFLKRKYAGKTDEV